ncbi:MAG TPA: hypothetical protein PLI73_07185, partial [Candidatus Cloacimonadota bacterium]|nr:hypothetical protein [Candidatus Cloacimonadota bacterium]
IRDIPENIQIELLKSDSQEASVFGSKAVGEPPLIYGMAVHFAIRDAIRAVRPGAELSFPATGEAIIKALSDKG